MDTKAPPPPPPPPRGELEEVSRHKKTAVLRFNTKPQLGLEYLKGLGLWDGSPEKLAAWIDDAQQCLSKRRIGDFFGGTLPLAQSTCDCWLERLDLAELSLDEALRLVLRRLRLPGEAQRIDRIIERFARAYKYAGNSNWPYSEDSAYVLSFSLVMLNTDLHSKSIKDADRMSCDSFVENNRSVVDEEELPEELLRTLYCGIRSEEIKMDDGDLYESELITFIGARKAGWLEKYNRSWRKYWFVLNDGCLYYFQSPGDVDQASKPPRAIIPLDQGLQVERPMGAAPGRELRLARRRKHASVDVPRSSSSLAAACDSKEEMVIKSVKNVGSGPGKVGTATELRLRAKDVADAQEWADALRSEEEETSNSNPLFVGATTLRAAAAERMRRRSATTETTDFSQIVSVAQHNSHTPLLAGWLRKRGGINTAWKKRYFALFSGVTCTTVEGESTPADEPVLMYFQNETKFRELVAGSERPYKGAVRLGAVKEMRRKTGAECAIALVTDDRVWHLSPAKESSLSSSDTNNGFGSLDPWWYALEGACQAAQLLNTTQKKKTPILKKPNALNSNTPGGKSLVVVK